ncbi:MAG: CRISPR-associated endonuclease Cas2 [Proteobacteria bacterium]|jgi:CRISPR-associated protein Cas2|nr:CRISPR-associated endonuclease Cas2 [Desulfocapsa sp.]MBU3945330.1 CRISPR-associated endonuclease Cas2 [Pseudomonadota bacterium]MCG2743096.1 CRISPR-associated endonuclease Cas2 [Desulfobacteraceae bacterium]MDO8948659.1 CRISPR-associated endonuclease Cas2 [Desulfocapsaceae bacterium]MBU3984867.1 CRISPR-associated endonuclease Cas2 [Pseudomonadota bacterium]
MRLLVIYDIADPRRLYQVARILKDYGQRVQQSKFELEICVRVFSELRARIAQVIDEAEDGVKYIPLCERCLHKTEIIGQGRYIDPDSEFVVV